MYLKLGFMDCIKILCKDDEMMTLFFFHISLLKTHQRVEAQQHHSVSEIKLGFIHVHKSTNLGLKNNIWL